MKKRIVLLLTLAMMVLAVAGCGKKNDASAIVGTWKVATIEMGGTTMDVQELMESSGQTDVKMDMVVTDDGKFTMDMSGITTEGTWKADGSNYILTVDGEDQTVQIIDGKLVMEQDGTKITFEK